MAGDVLSGKPINLHLLQYPLGKSILHPQVGQGIQKPLVELWGPRESGPLEGPGRPIRSARLSKLGGGRWKRWVGGRRTLIYSDIEGHGEVGGDEGLGERGELFMRWELIFLMGEAILVVLFYHFPLHPLLLVYGIRERALEREREG